MTDETQTGGWQQPHSANTNANTVGFCQDCGRPLTPETIRTVGTGVFCEPCLQVRLGTVPTPGSGTVPPQPPYTPPGNMPPVPGEPSPAVAGLLGMIPGVGAMYNGQFAKGIAHIIIFAVLLSFANHVSDIFSFVVFGWWAYMVFDAIHTARARRDGLPLPNMFNLNDIGERVGMGKGWYTGYQPAGATAGPQPDTPPARTPVPENEAVVPPPPPVSPATHANWAGYVPPDAFGGYATAPYATPPAYEPIYPGVPVPPASQGRFPVAAVWLIAFGALFLLFNIIPGLRISDHWIAPVILFVAGAAVLFRRISTAQTLRANSAITGRSYIVCIVRFPAILLTLSLLFTLQALNIATIGQTWPLLLILAGALALADRSALFGATVPPVPNAWQPASSQTVVPSASEPTITEVRKESQP